MMTTLHLYTQCFLSKQAIKFGIPHMPLSYGASRTDFLLQIRCSVNARNPQNIISRRSANYKPPKWNYNCIQSLTNPYTSLSYNERVKKLKSKVRIMFKTLEDQVNLLELIDVLQRIGLSDQFEDEIDNSLKSILKNIKQCNNDLCVISLRFRLLRQHGYYVSQDVFIKFIEKDGTFKTCLKHDTKGMLSLYESSFLSIKGETILEEAMVFTRKHLKQYLKENNDDNEFYLRTLVSHAMELPLQQRMQRLEARWFIDVYERKPDMNTFLLELAKLDFNLVQAIHQEDLKQVSRWWMEKNLGERTNFARDRLMVNFFWTVGISYKPQFQYDRIMMTKVISYILIFDDMYDIYGTLDELEVFTSVIERWDVNALDSLPQYMKLIFLSFYNDINEMGLKEKGLNVVPYLKKMWADVCKTYLLEAKWYNEGYTPTLQEYMENGFVSITTPLMCLHAYIFLATYISKHTLDWISTYQGIVVLAGRILRFLDDLGTSSTEIKRGDVPKSIQCYMHETGASEKDAREHIQYLTNETWKMLNEDRLIINRLYSKEIGDFAVDLLRTAHCIYQHGDGLGTEDGDTEANVLSLLIKPITI